MKYKLVRIALMVLMLLVSGMSNAVLITNAGGELTGATDIDIAGELFDVSFLDGTCISIFSGCNEDLDLFWQDQSSAILAANALLTQVFLDDNTLLYDTLPSLTRGCELNERSDCFIITPYSIFDAHNTRAAYTRNHILEEIDTTGRLTTWPFEDFTTNSRFVYAIWSQKVSKVPEPSTLAMLAIGIFSLGLRRFN